MARSLLSLGLCVAFALSSDAGICKDTGKRVTCEHRTAKIEGRNVYYQVPSGAMPNGGWPSVIIFHGWDIMAENSWDAKSRDSYGAHNKALLVKNLLENGFAVITPNSDGKMGYWYTNANPYASDAASDLTKWNQSSPDHKVLLSIFDKMSSWGMDLGKLHCAGFSSGGYMAARMVANYKVCKTASINSGSYYYCGGADCKQAAGFYQQILASSPPTLFLQGTKDSIVPTWTQKQYYDNLKSLGVTTNRILQQGADHQWIDTAPTDILNWIKKHGESAPSMTV